MPPHVAGDGCTRTHPAVHLRCVTLSASPTPQCGLTGCFINAQVRGQLCCALLFTIFRVRAWSRE